MTTKYIDSIFQLIIKQYNHVEFSVYCFHLFGNIPQILPGFLAIKFLTLGKYYYREVKDVVPVIVPRDWKTDSQQVFTMVTQFGSHACFASWRNLGKFSLYVE